MSDLEIRHPQVGEAWSVQHTIGKGRRETYGISDEYLNALYTGMTSGEELDERRRSIQASLDGDPTILYRIALVGGTIVGALISRYKTRAEYSPAMPFPPPDVDEVCEVESLYIDRNHHGRRIGTRLMQEHDAWAAQFPRTPSGLVVVATNIAAIAFYEKHGFDITDNIFRWNNLPPDQDAVDCYWMQRPAEV